MMMQQRRRSSSSAIGFSYLLLSLVVVVVCCVSDRPHHPSTQRIRRQRRQQEQEQQQQQSQEQPLVEETNINENPLLPPTIQQQIQQNNNIIIEYPSVFTINVPPKNRISLSLPQELQELISELDLLDVECYNNNNSNNTSTTSSDSSSYYYCKLKTLLHSQREYDYFQSTFDSITNVSTITSSSSSSSQIKMFVFEYDDDSTNTIITKEKRMMMKGLPPPDDVVIEEETAVGQQQRGLQNYNTIRGHSCFLNMDSMNDWIVNFVQRAPSYLNVSWSKIGESYSKTYIDPNEGYDIHVLRLTAMVSPIPYEDRSPIFILTGVHAREYSPPELMRRWIETFLTPNDNFRRTILESTVIHWIPYVNPDGRALAETSQPFRRKNVNPTNIESEYCLEDEFGVDLNRNFPFRWGLAEGSSSRGCIQTFRGETSASEPETQAVVDYAKSIFPESQRKKVDDFEFGGPGYDETTTTGVFIDIHSYGNYYIYPWGYENRHTPNNVAFQTMVSKISHFTGYASRGPGNDYTSPASGATDDFAYGELGAAGMTFEIGNSFHQDCERFELSVVDININALNYAASISFRPYSMSQGPDITTFVVQPTSLQFGDDLQVTITASDIAFTNLIAAAAQVQEVRLYIDQHPSSSTTNTISPDYVFDSSVISSTGQISVTLTRDVPIGTHTIYAQAMGTGFHSGPVASVTFTVEPGSGSTTTTPSPTRSPTPQPTNPPTPEGTYVELNPTSRGSGECTDSQAAVCEEVAARGAPFEMCGVSGIATSCPLTCGQCKRRRKKTLRY